MVEARAHNEAPQPSGLWDKVMPFVRAFLMMYAFQTFLGTFQSSPSPANGSIQQKITQSQLSSLESKLEHGNVIKPNALNQVKSYRNAFLTDDSFSLRLYLTKNEEFTFHDLPMDHLIWHIPNLQYEATGIAGPDKILHQVKVNVSVDAHLLHNQSMFAHVFFTKEGCSPNPADEMYSPLDTLYAKYQLNTYRPKSILSTKRRLLSSTDDTDEPVTTQDEDRNQNVHTMQDYDSDLHYISMWKPAFIINVVHDENIYSVGKNPVPPFLASRMKLFHNEGKYQPAVFMNDFWVYEEHLIPINDTLSTLPLEISYYPMNLYKFALYTQMDTNFKNQEASGASTKKDTDAIKKMARDTNPILLTVTVCVSILHTLFDFLAFKNDVSFWKNQKSLAGLSLRTIALNTFFQLVIFLYLMDNETSWMILASSFVGLLINAWKIKKAVIISRDPVTNKLRIQGVESYSKSPTAEHDRVAVSHLSFILYPLLVGFSAYSLLYREHKSWYSWVLSSLTSFVYMFGFIMMTPQLYINHKLKSVAHLPWRAMVYKSLNTFIDDLFAFVIDMPWMHRLSCFRDDLIFVIYLYQRWKYPVDHARTNEYGQGPEITDDTDDKHSLVDESSDTQKALKTAEGVTETNRTERQVATTEYLMTKRQQTLE